MASKGTGHIRWRSSAHGEYPELTVFLGRDDSGRKRYATRRLPPGTGRREARAALVDFVAETLDTAPVSNTATLAELWDCYWELRAPRLSPDTREGYERQWRLRVAPRFGSVRPRDITVSGIERWMASLSRGGGRQGGPLGASQVRQAHMVLRVLLGCAADWASDGWGVSRPTAADRAAKAVPAQDPGLAVRAPKAAVAVALLRAAREHSEELGLYVRMAMTTGARRGELAVLRWADLDLEAEEWTIATAAHTEPDYGRDGTGPVHTIGPPKNHQARTVALDAATVRALRSWRRRCETEAAKAGTALRDDAFVWLADIEGATYIQRNAWSARWRRLVASVPEAAGVRLHDLRHYAGTAAVDRGAPLTAVQARLGHSRLSTTQRYAKGRVTADRITAELLAAELDDADPDAAGDSDDVGLEDDDGTAATG